MDQSDVYEETGPQPAALIVDCITVVAGFSLCVLFVHALGQTSADQVFFRMRSVVFRDVLRIPRAKTRDCLRMFLQTFYAQAHHAREDDQHHSRRWNRFAPSSPDCGSRETSSSF